MPDGLSVPLVGCVPISYCSGPNSSFGYVQSMLMKKLLPERTWTAGGVLQSGVFATWMTWS